MSLTSVGLILLSAAIHVGWNLFTKSSSDPKVFSALKGLPILVLSIIGLSLIGIERVPRDVLLISVISGVIHAFYIYALSSAYEDGDLSLVYPVVRSSPALVPVAAWLFLGESLSVQGILGIGTVVVCIFALQWRQLEFNRTAGLGTLAKSRASLWSFVTLGMVVAYSLVDKEGMTRLRAAGDLDDHLRGLVFVLLISFTNYIVYWGILSLKGVSGFKTVLTAEWKSVLIASAGTIVSYSLVLHVMQTEKISYIVTLRQSSILMATIIGWLILKERHGLFRFFSSIIMIFGFILVVLAE